MHQVELEDFERLVVQAVHNLPTEFASRIANVEFTVEESARPDDYARTGAPPRSTLLGVYRGIPLTRRTAGYNMVVPDRIVIFRQPLQYLAADAADLEQRVARVVRHEIAHYFGISDDRLHELDAY
ncbi:MAG: metallopeptidase family protein [Chloroflexi bacterium]|nr:metallopeptidase family protein [Chloroflexota bacterium]